MDEFLFGLPLAIWVGIISVIAGLISAILTYFLGVLRTKRDLLIEYDKKILEERLMAYRELWKLFLPFARYQPPKITYLTLKKFPCP